MEPGLSSQAAVLSQLRVEAPLFVPATRRATIHLNSAAPDLRVNVDSFVPAQSQLTYLALL